MDINDFIEKIENEFDDIQAGTLKPDSVIREHVAWDSVNALIFIALVNVEYNVEINAEDLVKSSTVQDLFNIVQEKEQAQAEAN
jgi:acyl carrier protein